MRVWKRVGDMLAESLFDTHFNQLWDHDLADACKWVVYKLATSGIMPADIDNESGRAAIEAIAISMNFNYSEMLGEILPIEFRVQAVAFEPQLEWREVLKYAYRHLRRL